VKEGGASAVAIADGFHYDRVDMMELRKEAEKNNIVVRKI